jgi:hypothetical protein
MKLCCNINALMLSVLTFIFKAGPCLCEGVMSVQKGVKETEALHICFLQKSQYRSNAERRDQYCKRTPTATYNWFSLGASDKLG